MIAPLKVEPIVQWKSIIEPLSLGFKGFPLSKVMG